VIFPNGGLGPPAGISGNYGSKSLCLIVQSMEKLFQKSILKGRGAGLQVRPDILDAVHGIFEASRSV
jgi:hypothetical protein